MQVATQVAVYIALAVNTAILLAVALTALRWSASSPPALFELHMLGGLQTRDVPRRRFFLWRILRLAVVMLASGCEDRSEPLPMRAGVWERARKLLVGGGTRS